MAEGNGPIDFDCSGLTAWAWRQAGVTLVDYSYTQREATTAIPRSAAQPGDLVFWFGGDAHHVAIVTAVDGDQITDRRGREPHHRTGRPRPSAAPGTTRTCPASDASSAPVSRWTQSKCEAPTSATSLITVGGGPSAP